MGKEYKEGEVQPESREEVHWLDDGKRLWVDVH